MAMYCPRCGSFNAGQQQSCITCLGPLAKGQAVPADATCATHAGQPAIGRCMSCGKATCFECGSMVDGRNLCFTCAEAAATTTASTVQEKGKRKKTKK